MQDDVARRRARSGPAATRTSRARAFHVKSPPGTGAVDRNPSPSRRCSRASCEVQSKLRPCRSKGSSSFKLYGKHRRPAARTCTTAHSVPEFVDGGVRAYVQRRDTYTDGISSSRTRSSPGLLRSARSLENLGYYLLMKAGRSRTNRSRYIGQPEPSTSPTYTTYAMATLTYTQIEDIPKVCSVPRTPYKYHCR